MTAAITLSHVRHRYANADILKNLSFDILEKQFFIIIGPNGSGKTTLLKTIAGIEKPTGGKLSIFDRSIKTFSIRELSRTIAYVPQSTFLDFPFTVAEVVMMGRSPHLGLLGMETESDLDIAKQSMRFTDVEKLSHRNFNQLSGGERQRVYISRAVCQEPRVMLLDEPTAALDLGHQTRIMDLMDSLKDEKGMTIVMVSHDINLAALYADRILLMKDGQTVIEGDPSEVLTYENLETAYGCTVLVDESPLGKRPRITLVPRKYY